MRHLAVLLTAFLLLGATAAWSLPLNSYNEIRNPEFGTGTLAYWQTGVDIIVAPDGPDHGNAAICKNPGGDLWLRQVVDDSLSPGWLPTGNAKIVDLMADITWCGFAPMDSSVSFRLGWWDTSYNSVSDPTTLPHYAGAPIAGSDPQAGYNTTDWITCTFTGTQSLSWQTVNPFNRMQLPVQPRWVSVEARYVQPAGVIVWMDNVTFTSQCVPEPSGMLLLLSGVTPLALRRFVVRRKQA